MTRTRKVTLTVKEFSHLVSESLDLTNVVPPSQTFIDNTAVLSETCQKTHFRPSSFQRIFARPTPTPGQHESSPQGPSEDLFETPRKMIGWPFSRSPRKNRLTKDETTQELNDPDGSDTFPYAVSSPAAASTSSLGSLIPAHERLFQLSSQDAEESHVFTARSSSPVTIAPPNADDPPTASGCYGGATPLDGLFGNNSALSIASSTVEHVSDTSCQGSSIRPSSNSVAFSEPESFDEDPTPRASTFSSRATLAPSTSHDNALLALRGRQRLSLVVPSRNSDVLSLRPAIGVAPHPPTESSLSLCSTSSPTSPVALGSFPISPTSEAGTSTPVPPTPPNVYLAPSIASSSNLESPPVPSLGLSPRQRMRPMSRSLTPPPLPRPPPTGPLPAVPPVPPVPPLPPLLSKMSINVGLHSAASSTPRSSVIGASTCPATALPPSPPGGLRLPSRLSWVNSVRAVLPSPPASPTKSLRSLTGKTSLPNSPSKAEIKRTKELKRPTSIGVIEAADNNVQVRRTKSILLLGSSSRSKSNVSLGTKRVQIHANVNVEANPAPKPRRKSSAATVGHPTFSSDSGPGTSPMQSSELLVPRERRHSAPVLSSIEAKVSADWTLSLPFCTDVPGEKILLSPLLTPQLKSKHSLEDARVEDWTLYMPLKVRVDTPTIGSTEGRNSDCTATDTAETVTTPPTTQLPTPSPSPTWPTPVSVVRVLEPEESEPGVVEAEVEVEVDRPATPASLGPHVGGLDLGGRGKRASGWHVYGWFDEVDIPEDGYNAVIPTVSTAVRDSKLIKNHVTVFQKTHDVGGRHPSQDSMSSVSTSEATFYSARSSLLVS